MTQTDLDLWSTIRSVYFTISAENQSKTSVEERRNQKITE